MRIAEAVETAKGKEKPRAWTSPSNYHIDPPSLTPSRAPTATKLRPSGLRRSTAVVSLNLPEAPANLTIETRSRIFKEPAAPAAEVMGYFVPPVP